MRDPEVGQVAHRYQACAYFRFLKDLDHEATRSISTPPALDGMLIHHRVSLQHLICRHPFIHLSGERHCESKVFCPRTRLEPRPLAPEATSSTLS